MTETDHSESPTWVPLDRTQRRVLGVLVEKAKTTPDNYPLSLAALVAGANQKSNRSPQMQLDEDDVLFALDHLREVGAVREVQGSGRVTKYRHAAYEWLGVDAAGAAVMTELLLRGPQTAGELRARASRMHDFASLESLGAVLQSLQAAGLVQALSPAGRGQTFAHALYPADEQQYLAEKVAPVSGAAAVASAGPAAPLQAVAAAAQPAGGAVAPGELTSGELTSGELTSAELTSGELASAEVIAQLQQQLQRLEAEVEELRHRLDRIES